VDVVIRKSVTVLELIASENTALLVRGRYPPCVLSIVICVVNRGGGECPRVEIVVSGGGGEMSPPPTVEIVGERG